MTNRILDQADRNKIINDLHTNFLVEAGAGSGKTKSLVDRMINLIYTGTSEIHEIVAITFTRKAADELKVRFQSELEQAWKEEQKQIKRERLAHALQNIERCFLGTVHSFCAKLLRERPIEAGLDLTFTELEDRDDLDLLEEAWQIFLQQRQEERPETFQRLTELGLPIDELFQCLRDMKEYPDVEWVTSSISKPKVNAPYQSFLTLLKEAEKSIPAQEPEKGYDPLQKAIVIACRKAAYVKFDKDIIELYELFNKSLKPTQNRWITKEDAKFYSEKISTIVEETIKPLIMSWKEYCHPEIVHFLRSAINRYDDLKKERSQLNFQDLLLTASNLLKNHPPVRAYFQEKYRYLLIDEFQDSDPIQAELLFYLTSENINEKTWISCRPKPGSLFVVGDPKQAIYRFRRADIDTYNRVKQLIKQHGGEVLQLTMNFRSLDSVTNELNGIFKKYLPKEETIYQAAFSPLNSYHQNQGETFAGIKQLTVSADYSLKDSILIMDAQNITATIQNLIHEGHRPKDFMVLTRYTEGIALYANSIEDAGIPVSISGEIVIGETKEFQELVVLLQSFIDPTDAINIISVLRGVFFGISDDELYQWKKKGGSFSIYSTIPEGTPNEIKDKFTQVFSNLQLYQRWIRTHLPTVAIEKIIEHVGFYLLLLNNVHSKRAYKSLLQILDALRKLESKGEASYKQIINKLVEMINEKTVVANLEEDSDAVRVMNVHKAKGLEAAIVFLAHPAKLVNSENYLSKHIKREDDRSQGYFTFSIKAGQVKRELAYPLEWEEYKRDELRYLTEEEVRILYVASTRAEKALIISSSAKSDKKNPWGHLLEIDILNELLISEVTLDNESLAKQRVTIDEYYEASNGAAQLEELKEKSYEHWTPTKEKNFSEISAIERGEGGGKQFGLLVHDILEKLVNGYDVTHYIKVAMNKYDIPSTRIEEVEKWVAQFKFSSIWEELQNAEEILTEVPFTFKMTGEHPLYASVTKKKEGLCPIYIKGVIDLAYKLAEGWVIVDYKTDRPKDAEDFKKLESYYQDQLSFYKDAWKSLTNEKVIKEHLYFFYA